MFCSLKFDSVDRVELVECVDSSLYNLYFRCSTGKVFCALRFDSVHSVDRVELVECVDSSLYNLYFRCSTGRCFVH